MRARRLVTSGASAKRLGMSAVNVTYRQTFPPISMLHEHPAGHRRPAPVRWFKRGARRAERHGESGRHWQRQSADQISMIRHAAPGYPLLKAHNEAKAKTGLDLALYGQEMDSATAALARMNMILHDCPTAPSHTSSPKTAGSRPSIFIVAHPPFSRFWHIISSEL